MANQLDPRAHISIEDTSPDVTVKPRTWTRLSVKGEDKFTMIRGDCDIDLSGYADFGTSTTPWALDQRPKTWQTMIRRLDGTTAGNPSSRWPVVVPAVYNFAFRYVATGFQVDPDVPLSFDVWHDAPRDIKLRELVLKLHVVRAE